MHSKAHLKWRKKHNRMEKKRQHFIWIYLTGPVVVRIVIYELRHQWIHKTSLNGNGSSDRNTASHKNW